MGDGGPARGCRLVGEAARMGLEKVWDIPSLVAAKLGQVHFQNGDKDQSLVGREMTGRAISRRLYSVALPGLKLLTQIRLALNSQISACFCLLLGLKACGATPTRLCFYKCPLCGD